MINFNGIKRECFQESVSGKDYVRCEDGSKNMWCNSKPGKYGAGLANTKDDPYKVSRIGLIGETAFGKIFNLPVCFEYHKFGKKEDFTMGPNKKVDIKTAKRNYWNGLVMAKNDDGIDISLKADTYVFGFVEIENIVEKKAIVNFVGYAKKEIISTITPVVGRTRGSKHMNYEVPYDMLHPMGNLLNAHRRYLQKFCFKKVPLL